MIGWLLVSAAFGLDLEEARERAADQAIGVERAQADADAAAGQASAWRGRALPTVAGVASVNAGGGQTAFGFDRPTFAFFGVGVRGSWTVIDPSTWAAATAARRTALGQRAMLQWARVTARRDATVAFAQALAAEQVALALQVAADDAAEGAEAVQQRVRAGLRPPADAATAKADALSVAALATEARGDVASTCAALQGLLDLEVTGRCELVVVEDWGTPGEATGPHPAVTASEEALDASRASRSSALWAHAPTVSASGDVTDFLGVGVGWSANATVEVPLTGATAGPGEVKAASAAQRRAQAELDNQERALAVSAVSAEGALQAALAGLEARQQALVAAEEAWSQVDERYRAGLSPIADWLAARRGLQNARVGRARAQAAVGVAVAELEAARGVGD